MSGFVLGLKSPSWPCCLTQGCDPGLGNVPSRGGSPKVPVCASRCLTTPEMGSSLCLWAVG